MDTGPRDIMFKSAVEEFFEKGGTPEDALRLIEHATRTVAAKLRKSGEGHLKHADALKAYGEKKFGAVA